MGADFLFVSDVPFFVVFVFREIDVQLVFSSSHRVWVVGRGGRAWWSGVGGRALVVGHNYII